MLLLTPIFSASWLLSRPPLDRCTSLLTQAQYHGRRKRTRRSIQSGSDCGKSVVLLSPTPAALIQRRVAADAAQAHRRCPSVSCSLSPAPVPPLSPPNHPTKSSRDGDDHGGFVLDVSASRSDLHLSSTDLHLSSTDLHLSSTDLHPADGHSIWPTSFFVPWTLGNRNARKGGRYRSGFTDTRLHGTIGNRYIDIDILARRGLVHGRVIDNRIA